MRKFSISLAIVSLVLFLIILLNFESSSFIKFDQNMADIFHGNQFISAFHFIGSTAVVVTVALLLLFILWFKQHNYRGMLFVLLTIAGGRVLNQLLKNAVDRPRPEMVDQLTSPSFPSGHAMLSFLYLFTIAYLLTEAYGKSKKVIITWVGSLFLILLIGLSRIAVNEHFATDVISGWCIAYTWFVICVVWYEQRKRQFNTLKDNTLK